MGVSALCPGAFACGGRGYHRCCYAWCAWYAAWPPPASCAAAAFDVGLGWHTLTRRCCTPLGGGRLVARLTTGLTLKDMSAVLNLFDENNTGFIKQAEWVACFGANPNSNSAVADRIASTILSSVDDSMRGRL